MIETTLWHPVLQESDLGEQPVAAMLLEQEIVLWRDAQGAAHAWADRCPHRGARLSMGQVNGGELECPYHGWRFAPSGQCSQVPALPQFSPPATHCAHTHAVQSAYGLLWVRLEPGQSDLPPFKQEADARLRKVNCGPYTVEASAPRIVENFLDMSHFGFVHTDWLGDREHVTMPEYDVERDATGLLATRCMAWQPRSNLHSTGGSMVEYSYEIRSPYSCVLTKKPEDASSLGGSLADREAFREAIALFVCPITPERSRVWIRMASTDFTSPDASFQDFQNTIFGQDQPVLESQRPKRLPLDLRAELHTVADKASSAYRRYLKESGISYGVLLPMA